MSRAGGHLAKSAATGDLLLRESAQCPEAEEGDFQDVAKFKYSSALRRARVFRFLSRTSFVGTSTRTTCG